MVSIVLVLLAQLMRRLGVLYFVVLTPNLTYLLRHGKFKALAILPYAKYPAA
jgi:hypothetical protein